MGEIEEDVILTLKISIRIKRMRKMSEVGIDGVGRSIIGKCGIGPWKNLMGCDGVDRNLGGKLKIPSFQGRNDIEAYLEWRKKI